MAAGKVPVVGITGTGGAGKSSVTDEILNRFLGSFPDKRIAVLAVDPTRRRTGGALLGDRIRMNSLRSERVYMRSIATRRQHLATSEMLGDHIRFLKSLGFDLIIVETAGIGQSDSEIVDLVDFSMYVMTSDYGAASQLEKIDMLDFADLVVLNKYDKRGAEDALRDVRKQWKRNRLAFEMPDDECPCIRPSPASSTIPASARCLPSCAADWRTKPGLRLMNGHQTSTPAIESRARRRPFRAARIRYLAEIAEQGRGINADIEKQAEAASRAQHCYEALALLEDARLPEALAGYEPAALTECVDRSLLLLRQRYQEAIQELSPESVNLLREWPSRTRRRAQREIQLHGARQGNHRQQLS